MSKGVRSVGGDACGDHRVEIATDAALCSLDNELAYGIAQADHIAEVTHKDAWIGGRRDVHRALYVQTIVKRQRCGGAAHGMGDDGIDRADRFRDGDNILGECW